MADKDLDLRKVINRHQADIGQHHEPIKSTPERNLLAAILMRAIRDYLSKCSDSENSYSEARAWLKIDREVPKKDSSWTFVWICEHLDLEALTLRDLIEAESKIPAKESRMVAILTDMPTAKYNKY